MGITTDEVMSLQRLPKNMIEGLVSLAENAEDIGSVAENAEALASLAEKADDILALLDTSAEGETGAEGET